MQQCGQLKTIKFFFPFIFLALSLDEINVNDSARSASSYLERSDHKYGKHLDQLASHCVIAKLCCLFFPITRFLIVVSFPRNDAVLVECYKCESES